MPATTMAAADTPPPDLPASAPALSWPARALVTLVQGYRLLLSPWLGSACRFEPTCSAYALDALRGHGAARGAALSAWRIARCHPWCAGGHDPVPEPGSGLFTALLHRAPSAPAADAGEPPATPTPALRKTSV